MSSGNMAMAGDPRRQMQHPHPLQPRPEHNIDHAGYAANKAMHDHYSHSQANSGMGMNLLPHMTPNGSNNPGQVTGGMRRPISELGVNVNQSFNAFNPQQQNLNFANLGHNSFSNIPVSASTPLPKRARTMDSNSQDMSPRGFGSSRYKGVCWNKKQKKWRTRLSYQGKVEFLGDFPDEESAALAYDRRVKELYGNNSKRLNFPEKATSNKVGLEAHRFQGDQAQVKNRVTPVGLKQLLLQQIQDDAKANGMGIQFPKNANTAVKENSSGEVEVATQTHKKFLIGANRYYLGSSQYKGVCWNKKKKKWRARISNNGKREFLGDWDSEIKAAMIYDARARQLFRNVPNLRDRLNFPDGIKSPGGEQNDQASPGPSLPAAPSMSLPSGAPVNMYRGWPDQGLLSRNHPMNQNQPVDRS